MRLSDLRNDTIDVITENALVYSEDNAKIDEMLAFVDTWATKYLQAFGFKVKPVIIKSAAHEVYQSNVSQKSVAFDCYLKEILVSSIAVCVTCNKGTSPVTYKAMFGHYSGHDAGVYCSNEFQTEFSAKGNAAFKKKFRKE